VEMRGFAPRGLSVVSRDPALRHPHRATSVGDDALNLDKIRRKDRRIRIRRIGSLAENENKFSLSPRCRFPNPKGFSSSRINEQAKRGIVFCGH
jgi:hypothetical protein